MLGFGDVMAETFEVVVTGRSTSVGSGEESSDEGSGGMAFECISMGF